MSVMVLVGVALLATQQLEAVRPGSVQAIGPKQDDPLTACGSGPAGAGFTPGGIESIGPKQDDPRKLAIGPKQDDPLTDPSTARPGDDNDPKASGGVSTPGIIVQGGREEIGPKQDDPRRLAIGPKQDDPLKDPSMARPGDDNDPKASGGSPGRGIVVQGGIEAIGPKQDDPRAPVLAAGIAARPGDDEDPQALAQACPR